MPRMGGVGWVTLTYGFREEQCSHIWGGCGLPKPTGNIFESGLRDIGDDRTDDKEDGNRKDNANEYYDRDYARMSARIASTRSNTNRCQINLALE